MRQYNMEPRNGYDGNIYGSYYVTMPSIFSAKKVEIFLNLLINANDRFIYNSLSLSLKELKKELLRQYYSINKDDDAFLLIEIFEDTTKPIYLQIVGPDDEAAIDEEDEILNYNDDEYENLDFDNLLSYGLHLLPIALDIEYQSKDYGKVPPEIIFGIIEERFEYSCFSFAKYIEHIVREYSDIITNKESIWSILPSFTNNKDYFNKVWGLINEKGFYHCTNYFQLYPEIKIIKFMLGFSTCTGNRTSGEKTDDLNLPYTNKLLEKDFLKKGSDISTEKLKQEEIEPNKEENHSNELLLNLANLSKDKKKHILPF